MVSGHINTWNVFFKMFLLRCCICMKLLLSGFCILSGLKIRRHDHAKLPDIDKGNLAGCEPIRFKTNHCGQDKGIIAEKTIFN
jgi:hypothetical protein